MRGQPTPTPPPLQQKSEKNSSMKMRLLPCEGQKTCNAFIFSIKFLITNASAILKYSPFCPSDPTEFAKNIFLVTTNWLITINLSFFRWKTKTKLTYRARHIHTSYRLNIKPPKSKLHTSNSIGRVWYKKRGNLTFFWLCSNFQFRRPGNLRLGLIHDLKQNEGELALDFHRYQYWLCISRQKNLLN